MTADISIRAAIYEHLQDGHFPVLIKFSHFSRLHDGKQGYKRMPGQPRKKLGGGYQTRPQRHEFDLGINRDTGK